MLLEYTNTIPRRLDKTKSSYNHCFLSQAYKPPGSMTEYYKKKKMYNRNKKNKTEEKKKPVTF